MIRCSLLQPLGSSAGAPVLFRRCSVKIGLIPKNHKRHVIILRTMASSPSAAPFSAEGESIRKQVSPSRRSEPKLADRNDANIQITHVPLSPSSTSDAANRIILSGVAWKRRSGFGRLSDTVGVGKSWERRRFVLYAGGGGGPNAVARDGGTPRLVYYPLNEFQSQTTPRGTLDLLAERATIHAT